MAPAPVERESTDLTSITTRSTFDSVPVAQFHPRTFLARAMRVELTAFSILVRRIQDSKGVIKNTQPHSVDVGHDSWSSLTPLNFNHHYPVHRRIKVGVYKGKPMRGNQSDLRL